MSTSSTVLVQSCSQPLCRVVFRHAGGVEDGGSPSIGGLAALLPHLLTSEANLQMQLQDRPADCAGIRVPKFLSSLHCSRSRTLIRP